MLGMWGNGEVNEELKYVCPSRSNDGIPCLRERQDNKEYVTLIYRKR